MFGGYRRLSCIGSGFDGDSVYLAQSLLAPGERAALKWPAKEEEVTALRELNADGPGSERCFGIPRLLASGRYAAAPFVVTELLGKQVAEFFRRVPWDGEFPQRWHRISLVGRMAARRLGALHRRGFVHCDVSPENILFDREPQREAALFVVDLGLARRYPGGGPMRADLGSAEWSSVRSAEGRERRPEDDLEALGWVLVHALLGGLPWLDILNDAYEKWHSPTVRHHAVAQVQLAKREWLQEMGRREVDGGIVPGGLYRYLIACQKESVFPDLPDYASLNELLGGDPCHDEAEAESADLVQFQIDVAPFM